VRINKFLSERGICSRRQADSLIALGRVGINGKQALLGDQVSESDLVTVDGHEVSVKPEPTYLMYNKPTEITCTTERKISGNIIDAINYPGRIFPIGRLDKDSSGLIFLTNDGDIVNQILRAQFGHEKEYIVETARPFTEDFIKKMSKGVDIGDYITKNCKTKMINQSTFSIVLTEGKNRQIRRMCEALGARVRKLTRIRIMNIKLGDLKVGEWRKIPAPELVELKNILNNAAINLGNLTNGQLQDDE
jgi:23S rRNA pseudouridine2604 synthase